MSAIVTQAKNLLTFHYDHTELIKVTDKETGKTIPVFHSRVTHELFYRGSAKALKENNLARFEVGELMSLTPIYFALSAAFDAIHTLKHTAVALKNLKATYDRNHYTTTHILNVEIPKEFTSAMQSAKSCVKNYMAYYAVTALPSSYELFPGFAIEGFFPCLFMLYAIRNPIAFQNTFTQLELWWSKEIKPASPGRIQSLSPIQKVGEVFKGNLYLHQVAFKEKMDRIGNLNDLMKNKQPRFVVKQKAR